jgi:hypothetical protein
VAKQPSRKKLTIAAGAIVALAFVLYGVSELNYQHEVSAMKSGIEKAKSSVTGAVQQSPPTLTHGAHFIDKFACADVNCPQVEGTWLVPLASDDVGQFVASVKSKITEKDSGDLFFNRSKWDVQIFPSATDNSPSQAPAGKTWMNVHIFVTE